MIFTDTSGNAAPTSQGYCVTATSPTTLTITSPQLLVGTYGQTNGIITAALSNNGLAVGNPVYLVFTTGGAASALFQVASVIDTAIISRSRPRISSSARAVACCRNSPSAATRKPERTSSSAPPGRMVWWLGDSVFINFTSGSAVDGIYAGGRACSTRCISPSRRRIPRTKTKTAFPFMRLQAPVLNRSGNCRDPGKHLEHELHRLRHDFEPVAIAAAFANGVQFLLSRL